VLDGVLKLNEELFSLPMKTKEKYNEVPTLALIFPRTTRGVQARRIRLGPNTYPNNVEDPAKFRRIIDAYFVLMRFLAERIMRAFCSTRGLTNDGYNLHPSHISRPQLCPVRKPRTPLTSIPSRRLLISAQMRLYYTIRTECRYRSTA
jgi:isopenicillin N synthase-like dioxygenase